MRHEAAQSRQAMIAAKKKYEDAGDNDQQMSCQCAVNEIYHTLVQNLAMQIQGNQYKNQMIMHRKPMIAAMRNYVDKADHVQYRLLLLMYSLLYIIR